ncbi:hypothetical protein [Anaerobacillus alkalilacustris]|nr:hypothetical protein [Anaerobacillus alkalilacustris]
MKLLINLDKYPYKITLKKWKDEKEEYFVAKVPELEVVFLMV